MKHKINFAIALIVIVLSVVLAACQTTSPTQTVATATTSSAAASPTQEATQPASATATSASSSSSNSDSSSIASAVTARLNLNTATEADFLTVPGVGARMVREFLEYRPYTSILQFEKEIGKYVDAAQVAQYEQYVFVPISINESDAATLMQISGLDENEAQTLIAARPYASNDAFLTELAKVVDASGLAEAQSLLSAS